MFWRRLLAYILGLSILGLLVANPALAHDFFKFDSEVDRNQLAYTTVVDQGDGNFLISSKYSNGKKIDGDNFATAVLFLGPKNEVLGISFDGAAVDASFGGRAREVIVSKRYKLAREQYERLEWIGAKHYTVDTKNDLRIVGHAAFYAAVVALAAPSAGWLLLGEGLVGLELATDIVDESEMKRTIHADPTTLSRLQRSAHPQCPGYPQEFAKHEYPNRVICINDCDFHSEAITERQGSCVAVSIEQGNDGTRPRH
ncbi:hypothetical protein [uncultured Roseobacter sp.]|uniref:hypothetical protein n=1 Tax=uncultured Roseobacter sp. TaxID=114847 RepID=UPI00262B1516|nr:hypothetical protein [uncultured Roseobacter sp.]